MFKTRWITTTPESVGTNGRVSRSLGRHDENFVVDKKRRNGTKKSRLQGNGWKKRRNGTKKRRMRSNRRKKRRNGANFGDEKFGLVNSALTALYRVPRTTDTLLYAH